MSVTTNKTNQEQDLWLFAIKMSNILGADLKDQMLQTFLLERKKCAKCYLKLFKRLLNVEIHNTMVMYRSLPNNENIYSPKFRLSLTQGLMESNCSGDLRPVHQLNRHPEDSQNDISWNTFLPPEGSQNLKNNVWCAQYMGKRKNLFTGAVDVKQGCV
jgi:hypothetical protein